MSSKKESHWIPLADLMTVLMVMFLFISIAYMAEIENEQKRKDKIISDYEETKVEIYNELQRTFKKDFNRWKLELDSDLSIKFTNPQVLFKSGSADITIYFSNILSEFLPKYLNVLKKYKENITEIRIEGHTDTEPINKLSEDPYIDNMFLSQNRARNVLAFLRKLEYFKSLNIEERRMFQYLITANGLSYGRALDRKNKIAFLNNTTIDNNKSRRVEFRIVTASEKVVKEFSNK